MTVVRLVCIWYKAYTSQAVTMAMLVQTTGDDTHFNSRSRLKIERRQWYAYDSGDFVVICWLVGFIIEETPQYVSWNAQCSFRINACCEIGIHKSSLHDGMLALALSLIDQTVL